MHAFQSTQLFQLRRRCALGPVASGSRARSETIWPHLSVLRGADAGQLYLCVLPESALPESAVWQRCAAAATRARSLMLCIARRMARTERDARDRDAPEPTQWGGTAVWRVSAEITEALLPNLATVLSLAAYDFMRTMCRERRPYEK